MRTLHTLLAVPLLLLAARPAAAEEKYLPGYFGGNAIAALADVTAGPLSLQLTHFASEGCPCGGTNGRALTDKVGPVAINGLLSISATRATARADRTETTATATETSIIAGASLFGGLIHAGAIRGVAEIDATKSGFKTSTTGTHVIGLTIAGKKIAGNTPPNTTIALPGLGSATIYSIVTSGDGTNTAGVTVDAVLIKVTESNSFGLAVGATVSLGHASASYNRANPHHVVAGNAYIANASVQAINLLPDFGTLGEVGIGDCAGTGGITRMNSTLALNEGLFSIGAGTTTAFGGQTGRNTSIAQTTASLAGVSLLGGLIGAASIVSEATETATGNRITASTAGTQFGGLTIAGITLPLDVPPNTRLTLPLLGYVIVNEQYGPTGGHKGPLTVIALDIYVTTPNLMGLPVGTEITLAQASAIALPLPL